MTTPLLPNGSTGTVCAALRIRGYPPSTACSLWSNQTMPMSPECCHHNPQPVPFDLSHLPLLQTACRPGQADNLLDDTEAAAVLCSACSLDTLPRPPSPPRKPQSGAQPNVQRDVSAVMAFSNHSVSGPVVRAWSQATPLCCRPRQM